jgi:hypothetical protein
MSTETLITIWVVCGIIAALIGSPKGESGSGFLAGFLLGPLGIIFALFSKGNQVTCPRCQKQIHQKATICPYCRSEIDSSQIQKPVSLIWLVPFLVIIAGALWMGWEFLNRD